MAILGFHSAPQTAKMTIQIDAQIVLKPLQMEYAEAVFEGFDADVIRFLPLDEPPQKLEETQAFIAHSMAQMEAGTDGVWAIEHQKEFAGCCGIHGIPSRQPHFGIWIASAQQGKGVGKKVVRHMLPWAISNLDIDFVKYPVDKSNHRSIHLIEGLGLELSDNYTMGNRKKLDVDEYRLYKSPGNSIP